jgi:hypothetical protein
VVVVFHMQHPDPPFFFVQFVDAGAGAVRRQRPTAAAWPATGCSPSWQPESKSSEAVLKMHRISRAHLTGLLDAAGLRSMCARARAAFAGGAAHGHACHSSTIQYHPSPGLTHPEHARQPLQLAAVLEETPSQLASAEQSCARYSSGGGGGQGLTAGSKSRAFSSGWAVSTGGSGCSTGGGGRGSDGGGCGRRSSQQAHREWFADDSGQWHKQGGEAPGVGAGGRSAGARSGSGDQTPAVPESGAAAAAAVPPAPPRPSPAPWLSVAPIAERLIAELMPRLEAGGPSAGTAASVGASGQQGSGGAGRWQAPSGSGSGSGSGTSGGGGGGGGAPPAPHLTGLGGALWEQHQRHTTLLWRALKALKGLSADVDSLLGALDGGCGTDAAPAGVAGAAAGTLRPGTAVVARSSARDAIAAAEMAAGAAPGVEAIAATAGALAEAPAGTADGAGAMSGSGSADAVIAGAGGAATATGMRDATDGSSSTGGGASSGRQESSASGAAAEQATADAANSGPAANPRLGEALAALETSLARAQAPTPTPSPPEAVAPPSLQTEQSGDAAAALGEIPQQQPLAALEPLPLLLLPPLPGPLPTVLGGAFGAAPGLTPESSGSGNSLAEWVEGRREWTPAPAAGCGVTTGLRSRGSHSPEQPDEHCAAGPRSGTVMAATAEEAEPQLGMPAQAPSSDAQHAPSLLQPRAETGADTPRRPAQDPQSPPPPQEQLEAGTLLGLAVAGNEPQQEPEEQPIARPQPVAPRPQAGGATAGTAHAPGSSGRSTVSPRSTGSASIGGIRGDGGLSQSSNGGASEAGSIGCFASWRPSARSGSNLGQDSQAAVPGQQSPPAVPAGPGHALIEGGGGGSESDEGAAEGIGRAGNCGEGSATGSGSGDGPGPGTSGARSNSGGSGGGEDFEAQLLSAEAGCRWGGGAPQMEDRWWEEHAVSATDPVAAGPPEADAAPAAPSAVAARRDGETASVGAAGREPQASASPAAEAGDDGPLAAAAAPVATAQPSPQLQGSPLPPPQPEPEPQPAPRSQPQPGPRPQLSETVLAVPRAADADAAMSASQPRSRRPSCAGVTPLMLELGRSGSIRSAWGLPVSPTEATATGLHAARACDDAGEGTACARTGIRSSCGAGSGSGAAEASLSNGAPADTGTMAAAAASAEEGTAASDTGEHERRRLNRMEECERKRLALIGLPHTTFATNNHHQACFKAASGPPAPVPAATAALRSSKRHRPVPRPLPAAATPAATPAAGLRIPKRPCCRLRGARRLGRLWRPCPGLLTSPRRPAAHCHRLQGSSTRPVLARLPPAPLSRT